MKKLIFATILFLVSTLFFSCLKENHSIRLTNNFSQTIDNVMIGDNFYGSISAGTSSVYKSINTGNFTVSGTSASGGKLYGGGSVTGRGTHKWSVVLGSNGLLSVSEDK